MLYYRKDLGFNAPTSWQELIASAKQATSSGGVKFGFLWQAKQAEVLVCDLVSFIGSNGGAILQPDGKTVSIADEPAVEAVQLMRDLISKEQIRRERRSSIDRRLPRNKRLCSRLRMYSWERFRVR